jgi:cystathionine beta-lyase
MAALIADRVPDEVTYGAGNLGVLASIAAYREGGAWLDETLRQIADRSVELSGLLMEHLPQVRYRPPQASYLAWLDCRLLGLGDDPAATFLERGRVALSPGPDFGAPGAGFARLNFATTSANLREIVARMALSL